MYLWQLDEKTGPESLGPAINQGSLGATQRVGTIPKPVSRTQPRTIRAYCRVDRFRDLKLHRTPSLLLHDNRPVGDLIAMCNILTRSRTRSQVARRNLGGAGSGGLRTPSGRLPLSAFRRQKPQTEGGLGACPATPADSSCVEEPCSAGRRADCGDPCQS